MEENNKLDLEKVNAKYEAILRSLKDEKTTIEKLENEIKTLEGDITLIDADIEKAKRTNDTKSIENSKNLKKQTQEQIKNKKAELEIHRENLVELKGKIDKTLQNLRENPAISKHIDDILAKRYDRQNKIIDKKVKEKEKKKEETNKKLESLEKIKELAKNHPIMANNLKGILQNESEVKKLQDEQKKLQGKQNRTKTEDKRLADIDLELKNRRQKIDKNKKLILDYSKKNKLGITEKDLLNLTNYTVIDKNGQVNIDRTLNTGIKQLKTEIKDLDNEITKESKKYNINRQAIINLGKIPSEPQPNEKDEKVEKEKSENSDKNLEKSTETKPKWWQFVKRFKAWNERRNQKALCDGTEQHSEASKIDTKHTEFADSMKYRVIQDLVSRQSRESQKLAKRDTKQVDGREPGDD